jgi:hypothetical protein
MNYHILIDYDNLTTIQKRKGLLYNIELIIGQLTPIDVNSKNIIVRLYGGWYENNRSTKLAQDLSVEIKSIFPQPISLFDKSRVIVNVELANSLIIKPQILLYHTFRKRGIPSGLGCEHPVNAGCFSTTCPVKHLYEFIDQNKCSECKHVKPEQLLFRNEQKLVDSMITSDMIYISQNKISMSLVSSDDDFWPAILTAVTLGVNVTHFHTDGKLTNVLYSNTIKSNYSQKVL